MNMSTKLVTIKKYKPTTPGLRNKIGVAFHYLHRKRTPFLLQSLGRKKFRNSVGNLVNYNRQFGNKKLYRLVDFKRNFKDILGTVIQFEYDPNRSSNLALIQYVNGTLSYIVDVENLNINDSIISRTNASLNLNYGDCFLLKDIPLGTIISNIEKTPDSGAVYLRAAGNYGLLFQKNEKYAKVQFKSGVVKEFSLGCTALIGKVAGFENKFIKLGKAGVSRWKGRRPIVRGVAKNPVDHPHGGGNGKTSGGRPSVSRWGNYAKGVVKKNRRV